MNLTNLFNYNFLKENIKRSRAIILLLIFLIPVINVIYFLMNSVNSNIIVPTIMELQPLSIIGTYIIPVILSITLFSFVYKRKSSDFVMSFPVSKKQIFISNTIGGIIILTLTNLVNYIFILIASLLLNNILIDYRMLFDLFLLWTITYIFVFTCANIAVSVSSNKITTIVVTLLVLFLVPFTHTFITSNDFKGITNSNIATYCDNELCKPKNYKCYDTECEINKRKNIYSDTYYEEIEQDSNYTMPYSLIYDSLLGSSPNISKSLLKMFFLSVIYIIIGLILFTRKKFEIVETSFKSEKVHIIVRSLTIIPILCIYYIILINSSIHISDIFTIIFLLVILVTYIIIYDLLTRKKVTNILKSLLSILIVGILVVLVGDFSSSNQITQINIDDISKMRFEDINTSNNTGYTTNKELINYIASIHISNQKAEENYYRNFNIKITVNNKEFAFRISTTKDEYNYIINSLNNDKTYQSTKTKIKEKYIFAIEVMSDKSYINKNNKLYKEIIKELQKESIVKREKTNSLYTVVISIYNNFEVKTIYYDINDIKLQNEILNHYNSEVEKTFKNTDINIHTYYTGVVEENILDEEYLSVNYKEDIIKINTFMLDNLDNKVDITKPYSYIKFYTDEFYKGSNIFITNKVEELEKLINEIKQNEEKNNLGDKYDEYTY